MTVKLYDNDSYATDFDAVVLKCEKCLDKYKTELDRTLFFPEEGGQCADKGTIDGVDICHVELCGDTIYHYSTMPFEVGKAVHGTIDFKLRFRNMQNHSGEHIICGIAHKLFGYDNVGFHLGDDYVTMDLDGLLSEEDIEKVEYLANEAVIKNMPVSARYLTDEEIKLETYRAKGDIKENVRLVTIGDVDKCACCAPHVKYTGEIGMIRILDAIHYKGGMRLNILCGFDALCDYNKRYKQAKEISSLISVKQEDIAAGVKKLTEDVANLKIKLSEKTKQIIKSKIESIEYTPNNICLFANDLDAGHLRLAANDLKDKTSAYAVVLTGNDKDGYRYIIISARRDVSDITAKANAALMGKGGGKGNMSSGTFSANEKEINTFFTQY